MILHRAPRVVESLGGEKLIDSLRNAELRRKILETLSPYDAYDDRLPKTILTFEKWFELERQAHPGKRGKSIITAGKIKKAISLAKNGYRQIDIAKKMCVEKSTVSMWRKNNKDFQIALKSL